MSAQHTRARDELTPDELRRSNMRMTSALMDCEEALSKLGVGMSVGKRDALLATVRRALEPIAKATGSEA